MLIKDWMAQNPVTITEDTSMIKAIHIMKERRFRRLPVVAQGKLVGMVTDRDLKEASPSKATTLDVHELYYLLAELQVQEIMSRNPISVSQDDTVEHAAQIMLEHTISGLPVVDATGKVVGIITQSDVFRAFMHITGMLQGGCSSPCAWKTAPASSRKWWTCSGPGAPGSSACSPPMPRPRKATGMCTSGSRTCPRRR